MLIMRAAMTAACGARLDRCDKSASVRRLFACAMRFAAQQHGAGETFYDNDRSIRPGTARTHAAWDHPRRADNPPVHRGKCLSRSQGRSYLRDVDSRGSYLDGPAALSAGLDDP